MEEFNRKVNGFENLYWHMKSYGFHLPSLNQARQFLNCKKMQEIINGYLLVPSKTDITVYVSNYQKKTYRARSSMKRLKSRGDRIPP